MPPTTPITTDGITLGTSEFWQQPLDERAAAFAALRDRCPVSFHAELAQLEGAEPGPGFWSVVRYDDVRSVSRRPWLFSSASGITLNDQAPETLEFFGSMIVMDDPRHAKFRQLVQKGFTPKTVAKVEQSVRVRARQLIVDAAEMGECDFVQQFAAPLPLQVIADMLGVPAADEKQIFEWTNQILGAGDPEFGGSLDALIAAAFGMYSYAQELGQDRLDHPRDDITSALMHAEVEGQRLTTQEFGSFFILLAVAGNETTRNAISWGMHQLTEHPDQLAAWQAGFDSMTPAAIEEIVRWASPVIHMRRTANEDTEIGGPADRRRRQGGAVVLVGEPGRARVRPGPPLRHHPPERQGAGGLRRRRTPLLPRGQPRPAGDHPHVRGAVPLAPRPQDHVGTRPPAVGLHQRHQAHAVLVHADQGAR